MIFFFFSKEKKKKAAGFSRVGRLKTNKHFFMPIRKTTHFVLLLKIINLFFGKIINASYSKKYKKLKNGIEILVEHAVFKLWIKTVKMLFGSITQEPIGLSKFWCYFLNSLDNLL